MDREFVDYQRLYTIHKQHPYYIIRAKIIMKCRRMCSAKVDKVTVVLYD